MLNGFETYSSYKDSGVDWLGSIPSEWDLLPAMRFIQESKNKNEGMIEDQVLSLSYGNIVKKSSDQLTGLVPESFETYQIVEKGDIIIRGTDLQNDKTSLRTGLSKYRGIITSAYLNLRHKEDVCPKYLHYFFHSMDISKSLYKFGSGLRQNLSFEDFKRMQIPDLEKVQQTAIASFLDDKTEKVDRAIAIKKAQIARLQERKQILIQTAVTRGLDPNVRMKESGVDWIGEIPAHWEVKRLKHLITSQAGYAFPSTQFSNVGTPIIRIGDLKATGHVSLVSAPRVPERFNDLVTVFGLNRGDILMAMTGGTIGKTAEYQSKAIALLNQRVCRFRNKNKDNLDFGFFKLFVETKYWKTFIDFHAFGGAQPNISDNTVLNMLIPIPNLYEQKTIVAYFQRLQANFSMLISLQKAQIQHLREYRASLINAAVTGKIKVPNNG